MLPTREWVGGTREEYETQHFGFGSQQLSIALRGVVEYNIVNNVRGMESSLLGSVALAGVDDGVREELTRAHDELISMYCRLAGPAVKRIDGEIEKLLEIPDSTILPEDEQKATKMTEKEIESLRLEVATLQKRVQRGALMEALLSMEEEEMKSVEKHCVLAQKTIQTLESYSTKLLGKSEVMKRVVTDTDNLCSGFPLLKSTFL